MRALEGSAKDDTIAKRDGTFRVLGIDPGSHVTGYGVVEKAGGGLRHIVHGEIRPGKGATLTHACSPSMSTSTR